MCREGRAGITDQSRHGALTLLRRTWFSARPRCGAIEPADVAAAVWMVLSARPGTVFDEVNLSPQKKVIEFTKDARIDELASVADPGLADRVSSAIDPAKDQNIALNGVEDHAHSSAGRQGSARHRGANGSMTSTMCRG